MKRIQQPLIVFCMLAGIIGLVMMLAIGIFDFSTSKDWPERGVRGDFWGGHVAAGMAVVSNALFAITLLLQLQELGLQRKELSDTRLEMTAARVVSESQRDEIKRQTEAAKRSSAIASLVALLEHRNRLTMDVLAGERGGRFVRAANEQLVRLTPVVNHYLGSNGLDEVERNQYVAAFGPWRDYPNPGDKGKVLALPDYAG